MPEKDLLDRQWVWMVGAGLICVWLYGVIHAFVAHSTSGAVIAMTFPPYGLYLSTAHPFNHGDGLSAGRTSLMADVLAGCIRQTEAGEKVNLNPKQYEVFCQCSAKMLAKEISDEDLDFVMEHGMKSQSAHALWARIRQSCYSSAAYLGND